MCAFSLFGAYRPRVIRNHTSIVVCLTRECSRCSAGQRVFSPYAPVRARSSMPRTERHLPSARPLARQRWRRCRGARMTTAVSRPLAAAHVPKHTQTGKLSAYVEAEADADVVTKQRLNAAGCSMQQSLPGLLALVAPAMTRACGLSHATRLWSMYLDSTGRKKGVVPGHPSAGLKLKEARKRTMDGGSV